MSSGKPSQAKTPLTFEQSLEQLESIVRQLEEGRLGLSEALERYEQGVRHLRNCYDAIKQCEQKIELLTGIDADGNPVTQPFGDAEMSLEQKQAARGTRRSHSGSRRETSSNVMDDEDDLS